MVKTALRNLNPPEIQTERRNLKGTEIKKKKKKKLKRAKHGVCKINTGRQEDEECKVILNFIACSRSSCPHETHTHTQGGGALRGCGRKVSLLDESESEYRASYTTGTKSSSSFRACRKEVTTKSR